MIQHMVKTRMFPVLLIFLCAIVPNTARVLNGTLNEGGVAMNLIFILMFLIYAWILAHCDLNLRKLQKKYSGK